MSKTVEASPAPATFEVGELVKKIETLHGAERAVFTRTLTKEQKKSYIDYIRDRDTQMVRGTFRCHEPQGGSVSLNVRPFEGCEYQYTLEDGKEYSIPLFLAKRLNGEWQGIGTWHPTHRYILDQYGKPITDVSKRNYRFSITSDYV